MIKKQALCHSVAQWLRGFLSRRYPQARDIFIQDTSRLTIANFLKRYNALFSQPHGKVFDIKVDVAGGVVLPGNQEVKLAIVHVELDPINLRDLCRILGLAHILEPAHAFIISPKGWTSSLHQLIRDFHRMDVLEYARGQYIIVAKWDLASASIRPGEVLTYGQVVA